MLTDASFTVPQLYCLNLKIIQSISLTPQRMGAGSEPTLAVPKHQLSLGTPGKHIPFHLAAASSKEGRGLGLQELDGMDTSQKQCWEKQSPNLASD